MKNSVKINYFYNMIYQVLAIIIPIITTPYISRVLGANGVGTYSYTYSIVTYFICIGALGVNLYGQREIAYVQNDISKRSKVFFELFLFKLTTLFTSTILFYLIFARSGEHSLYFKILLLELLGNCIDISWFFQGLEDFKKMTIRNFIIRIINIAAIFIFVKSSADLWKYILVCSLSTFVGSLILFLDLKKYIRIPKKINIKPHIIPILLLFIPQIATSVYTILDKTMLGSILNNMTEVGYYEQSQKIIRIVLTIITTMGTTMMPRIASCFANDNKDKINIYMKKTFNFVFLLAIPMILGINAVASNFIPVFFGDGYDRVIIIISLMSVVIFFISLSSVTGNQYLLVTKKQKQYTISVIIGACINFILNFIFIKKYQAIGAVIATIVAEFSVAFIQLYYIRKEFKISNIFKMSVNYFISAIVMFIICIIIDKLIINNLIGLIVQLIVGILTYFIVLIFILKDKFILQICTSFFDKIRIR